jgi:hypothetical protein
VLCPTPTYDNAACDPFGELHVILLYDELVVRSTDSDGEPFGPKSTFGFSVSPSGPATVDVAWEIVPLDPDPESIAQGTIDDLPTSSGYIRLPAVGDQPGLVHGTGYGLRIHVEAEVDGFGPLSGTGVFKFRWDDRVEVTGMRFEVYDAFLEKNIEFADVFYPRFDYGWIDGSWRDRLEIVVPGKNKERLTSLSVTITDEDGEFVDTVGDSWNGEDADRDPVPEGTYTLTLTAIDAQDNEVRYQRSVRVSHEELLYSTWRKKVTPRESLFDKSVGKCARLLSPARKAWRGSLGFRSSTKGGQCRKATAQTVSTIHAIKLPKSSLGRYDRYRKVGVSTYGGAPHGAGLSYLVQYYWSTREKWIERQEFDGKVKLHTARRLNGDVVVHGDPAKDDPYFYWSLGLASGASFDVKAFYVEASYYDVGYRH